MRRRAWHLAFGAAALACAAVVAASGLRLAGIERTNRAIAAAQASVGSGASAMPDDAAREVRLARALALARTGDHDAAFKAYTALIQPEAPDAVGRQALYNLANMHLRQASNGQGSAPAITMVELAKQRYRDLLRVAPDDWDARYNLERAVRLAPEEELPVAEDENGPLANRRVRLPDVTPLELP